MSLTLSITVVSPLGSLHALARPKPSRESLPPCSTLSSKSQITIKQSAYFHKLTKCSSRNSFVLIFMHFDGAVDPPPPLLATFLILPSSLFPFFSYSSRLT